MTITKNNNIKASELLKESSLEQQGNSIKNILLSMNAKANTSFNHERLFQHVIEQGNFSNGLISYLQELKIQLEQELGNNRAAVLFVLQAYSEMGSLVYPDTAHCYSLIPREVNRIDWGKCLHSFVTNNNSEKTVELIKFFNMIQFSNVISSLVSLTLCDTVGQYNLDDNTILVASEHNGYDQKHYSRPRVKSSAWISRLRWHIFVHLHGLQKNIDKKHSDEKNISYANLDFSSSFIKSYSATLSNEITTILLEKGLLISYSAVGQSKPGVGHKTPSYLAWNGSNLLTLPKKLTLPMIVEQNDWALKGSSGVAGGYKLSEFASISYQGYLGSKSQQMHNHRLSLKYNDHTNQLQKVQFKINPHMLSFITKFKEELTDNNIALVTDKWINPDDSLHREVTLKWSSGPGSPRSISSNVWAELYKKEKITLQTQEVILHANFYKDLPLFWPVVQDFRGRIYRVGRLNIQLDTLVRSLITFYDESPRILRRKQSKKSWELFNTLLSAVLVEEDLIEKWLIIFGQRSVQNDIFYKYLLQDLLADKIDLLQVSQLLLIRNGDYGCVGIYMDASASAYQIMSVINQDRELCALTNVLKSPGSDENEPSKKDIYAYFLNALTSTIWSDPEFKNLKKLTNEQKSYLQKNFNRKLTKAIVMPLIYGKTGVGFADDLTAIFYKDNIYPNPSDLLKLANLIIKILKQNVALIKINLFMQTMRSLANLMHDNGDLTIVGPFSDCSISYHKEIVERVRIYGRTKQGVAKAKRISIVALAVDEHGSPIKSKIKTVNSFVANYIHYLDSVVCQYVIKQCATEHNFKLATIHDSFLVPPEKAPTVNLFYRQGLVLASIIHQYNLLHWLKNIIENEKCNFDKSELQSILSKAISDFQLEPSINPADCGHTTVFQNDSFFLQLEAFKSNLSLKKQARFALVINYTKMYKYGAENDLAHELLSNATMSLFSS